MRIALACFVAFALWAAVPCAAEEQASEINVLGTGSISVSPDYAVLSFLIEARGKEAVDAAQQCDAVYQQVLGSLQNMGYARKEIVTNSYRIEPWRDRDNRKVLGSRASHSLHFSTNKLDMVGPLVDAILASGVPTIQQISYGSSKADSIRQVALATAVKNARADAEIMAEAAGGSLGALVELTTHFPENPTFRYSNVAEAMALKSGVVRSVSITPEQVTARVTVLGRWKFIGGEAKTSGGSTP